MFEYLIQSMGTQGASTAVHHAIQVIRQWAAAAKAGSDALALEDSGLDRSIAELTARIVHEIETKEGVKVAQLSPEKVDDYVRQLSERLLEVSRMRWKADPEVGRSALNDLRSRFNRGDPSSTSGA